jgi:hypothetical protein
MPIPKTLRKAATRAAEKLSDVTLDFQKPKQNISNVTFFWA